jgi:hypothetical protein
MTIERKDEEMRTKDWLGCSPVTCAEIDYRIQRLQAEAASERLAGPRDGIRQHVGHALMALGRAIHGLEEERAARPALDVR